MPSMRRSIETSFGNSRRASGSPPVSRTSVIPSRASRLTRRSISSKLSSSERSSQGMPSAGMQYRQRKLQRSVTETRRSVIGRPWASTRRSTKPEDRASGSPSGSYRIGTVIGGVVLAAGGGRRFGARSWRPGWTAGRCSTARSPRCSRSPRSSGSSSCSERTRTRSGGGRPGGGRDGRLRGLGRGDRGIAARGARAACRRRGGRGHARRPAVHHPAGDRRDPRPGRRARPRRRAPPTAAGRDTRC